MLKLILRPVWFITLIALILTAPVLLSHLLALFQPKPYTGLIAPFFTPQVQYWQDDIVRWSQEHQIDPNLMATIMQIESCGHPTVNSPAGAQGLFQVMPFHFSIGEDMLEPNTNALRSGNFINACLGTAKGDAGLTMACYNGGQSIVSRPYTSWAAETQRYYAWGTGIYADTLNKASSSETLNKWLLAGGFNLCNRATVAQRNYR